MKRDPLTLVYAFLLPLLVGGLVFLAFGGREGPRPRPRVLLVDRDESFVSRLLAGALGGGEWADFERVDLEEGRRRIDRGEATALVLLPRGFGRAVLREEPVTVTVVENPEQRILPGMVREVLTAFRDLVFYVHRAFGPELRELVAEITGSTPPTEAAVTALSARIHRAADRVADALAPLRVRLIVEEPAPGRTGPSPPSLLFVPGLLLMGLWFLGLGFAQVFWEERRAGTLRRLAAGPVSPALWLAARTAAAALAAATLTLAAVGAGVVFLDLSAAGLPEVLLWGTLGGTGAFLLLALAQMLVPTQRGAALVGAFLVFPLLMAGGSFFPLEVLPRWLAAVGRFTPNGWTLGQVKAALLGRSLDPLAAVATVAAAALLFAAAALRLRAFAKG